MAPDGGAADGAPRPAVYSCLPPCKKVYVEYEGLPGPGWLSDTPFGINNEDYRLTSCTRPETVKQDESQRRARAEAAGGSDNVLSMLTLGDKVESVDAVDLNPAQNHLLLLKQAAVKVLERRGEVVKFLGLDGDHSNAAAGTRIATHKAIVRDQLPPETQSFWDTLVQKNIAYGASTCSRFEKMYSIIRKNLSGNGFDMDALFRKDKAGFIAGAVARGWGSSRQEIDEALIACQPDEIFYNSFELGRMKPQLLEYFERNKDAYRAVFAGERPPAAVRHLLSSSMHTLKAESPPSLRVHVGNVVDLATILAKKAGRGFDLITLSNIGDWLDEENLTSTIKSIEYALAPGELLATSGGALRGSLTLMRNWSQGFHSRTTAMCSGAAQNVGPADGAPRPAVYSCLPSSKKVYVDDEGLPGPSWPSDTPFGINNEDYRVELLCIDHLLARPAPPRTLLCPDLCCARGAWSRTLFTGLRVGLHCARFSHAPDVLQLTSYGCPQLSSRMKARGEPERKLRLLAITGGSDNVLSMLTLGDKVASVDAVDLTPAQNHLLLLKQAAVKILESRGEIVQFLGLDGDHSEAAADTRVATYKANVRDQLPPETQSFWDTLIQKNIAYGASTCSQFEKMYSIIRKNLTGNGFDMDALLRKDKAGFIAGAVARGWGSSREAIDEALIACQPDEIFYNSFELGRMKPQLLEYFVRTLTEPFVQASALLQLSNIFSQVPCTKCDPSLTKWIVYKMQALKAESPPSLRVHVGNVVDLATIYAEKAGRGFDLITLSNIGDWLDEEKLTSTIKSIESALAPGGLLLHRRALGNQRRSFEGVLDIDEELVSRLPFEDHSHVFWGRPESVFAGSKRT
eukprot:SM000008S22333  [mRNA]  locus=s8:1088822:1097575:+ [translate_table: standard]